MMLEYGQQVEWKRKRNGLTLTTKAKVIHQWSNKVKITFYKKGLPHFQTVPVSQVTLIEEEYDEDH